MSFFFVAMCFIIVWIKQTFTAIFYGLELAEALDFAYFKIHHFFVFVVASIDMYIIGYK